MSFRNSSRISFNTRNFWWITRKCIVYLITFQREGATVFVSARPPSMPGFGTWASGDGWISAELYYPWKLLLATPLQDSEVKVVTKYAKPSLIIITRWNRQSPEEAEYKLSQKPVLREAEERLVEKYGEATRLSDEVRGLQTELVIPVFVP